ncbi:protocadherin Fat 1/2/3 [Sarotherodon galilaeus]
MDQMSESETKNSDLLEGSSATNVQQSREEEPRRSQRSRKLTEKAQQLHDDKSRKLQHRFTTTYDKWKVTAKQAKKMIKGAPSVEVVKDLMCKLSCASANVKNAYEDLRKCASPDSEIRRRVDTCDAVSKIILDNATTYLQNKDNEDVQTEDLVWPKSSSVFSSSASQGKGKGSQRSLSSASSSSIKSRKSSLFSIKRQEAVAELAATQAALKKRIERIALQEEENVARKKALEEKRRQIERLQTVKKLSAAKARFQVYEQDASSDEEITELLHNHAAQQHRSPGAIRSPREHPVIHQADSVTVLAEAIAESINVSRLPAPEPSVFMGDPLRYNDWKMSFQTLIGRKNIPVNERVYYLRKYVGGPAKRAIESYFLLGTDAAYNSAWDILEERFGSSFVIAKAFKDKLAAWPKIGPKDSVELRDFSDFLRGCQAAMSQIKSLEVLNDCDENQKLLTKLPDWLVTSWNRKVIEIEETCNVFPTFSQFVEFITKEAKIACNPVTSLHALKSNDVEKIKTTKTRNIGAKVFVSKLEENVERKRCTFCEKCNHGIQTCWKFKEKPVAERVKFVQTKKLCFGCLQPGHHSKTCKRRSVCETCKEKHPTCLHEDRERATRREKSSDEHGESVKNSKYAMSTERTESKHTPEPSNEATSNRVVQGMDSMYSSTVVPVWLSASSNPENEILVYALLDNQSDTTFIMQDKAEALDMKGEAVQLKLSTLSSRNTIIPSQRLVGLQVRGFYSSKKISLPVTYSREFIPANLSHIPTPKTARAWLHLEHLAEEIAPLIECDVGLLIGYNCPQALLPREVVPGKDNEPFAQRTDLGWSIVGCVSPCVDYGDAIGSSHKIVMKSVKPHLQTSKKLTNEVKYICRTQVKEFISPPDVLRMLESDFSERRVEDAKLSQEDLRFLTIMEEGIKIKADGHCEMPLPFKKDRPNLPDNKVCALFIIATVQSELFFKEIKYLKSKETITRDRANRLYKLNPFLDEKGVLRVGGRLKHADLHPHIKHPAILPSKTHISRLLIEHFHQKVHHQGRGMTMNELRSNGIWLLGCSHAVSSYIYKCVKCRKFRRNAEVQRMADLPRERVGTSPPFSYCGMDCFGPFYVKEGRKELKRYGLLFTCLCSRAVHIELLDDMTSDAFINALRTFIAIRGSVRQLRSDQGTNFVGARREFLESAKKMDQESLRQLGCEFVMNPASASHMGGAWERQIRTIRSVLTSILDHSSKRLDTSSLRTFLYEVMAIINSRPLTTHLLNDPTGPQPLTPNHILTMKSSVVLPPPGEFVKEDLYLRKRWRKVQYLANEFWTRWKREYLLNLQQRGKRCKTQRNAKINDIVMLMDNSLPRNEWKLAKVTKVYPSEDGIIRKLELLISDATLDDQGKRVNKPVYLERPIHKSYPT